MTHRITIHRDFGTLGYSSVAPVASFVTSDELAADAAKEALDYIKEPGDYLLLFHPDDSGSSRSIGVYRFRAEGGGLQVVFTGPA